MKFDLNSVLFEQLIDYYVKQKYTLRYTGGMVPDVNQVYIFFVLYHKRFGSVHDCVCFLGVCRLL